MYSVDLQWLSFSVDLPSIEAWVKANFANAGYTGNSADHDLSLWFTQDPNAVPMTSQTNQIAAIAAIAASASLNGDTLTAETAGAAGNVQLSGDGVKELHELVSDWNTANPSNQIALTGSGSQIPDAGSFITLSGGADGIAASSVTVQVPSGAPSIAQQIQAHWAALTPQSAEAVAYTAARATAQYAAIAQAAIDFGNAMVVQFAGQNLQLGITAAGKTKTVRQAMQEVTNCLTTGSLIEAIAEIKAIPQGSYDSTFITAARLLSACNQLEKFCGLTLSTSLS